MSYSTDSSVSFSSSNNQKISKLMTELKEFML